MTCREAFLLVLITATIGGCSGIKSGADANNTKPANPADGTIHLKPEQARANGIESVEVTDGDITPVIAVAARVRTRAGGEAHVFSPFPGRLVGDNALPRIGQSVAKGQHIADVEQQFAASEKLQFATTAIELQASIQQAQQEVDLKRIESNRAQQLYDGGAIPLKQLQAAQFELQQAEAKLEGARRSKQQYDAAQSSANSEPRRAPITAPISGIVIAADATLGQQVEPAKNLLTIADLSTVWVEAAVHERDLPRIRAAREAEIVIPGSEQRPLIGRLVTIGNLVDPQNRTVPVTFSVMNRGTLLKLEMFVEADIAVGPPMKAHLIPSSAVLSEEAAYSVYVESEAGVYRRRRVQLGQRKEAMVVVTSGLEKGEKVVSVGAQTLRSESLKGEIPMAAEEKKKAEKKR